MPRTTTDTQRADWGATVTGDTAPTDPAAAALRSVAKRLSSHPREIGRYRIAGRLGQGGMGSVFAAYDPELDRQVAVKLLRSAQASRDATARMLREAKALAALSHPNIVSVFEVGLFEDDCPFIAMEFVEGRTLDEFIEDERPSWRRVLELFGQAGLALVAAHERGIVHRDFKPANVLVDPSGRVRVLDFGLASVTETTFTWDVPTEEHQAHVSSTWEQAVTESYPALGCITQTGTMIGTPAYMAPEQYLCEPIGPAADQFSLCVALWEALYKTRPFTGLMMDDVIDQVRRREFTAYTPESGLPRRLRKILERGLAFDPSHRFPTLGHLLDELAKCRRPKARIPLLVVGGLGMAAAFSSSFWIGSQHELSRCEPAAKMIQDVWPAARTSALSEHYEAYPASWGRIEGRIDGFASRWGDAYEAACPAEQSAALSDESVCLQRRLATLDMMLGVLEEAPASALVETSVDLPSIAPCIAANGEDHGPAPAAEIRDAVDSMWVKLDRADALTALGQFDEATKLAAEVEASADKLGYAPVAAAAQLRRGQVYRIRNRSDEALQTLRSAYDQAMTAGDDHTAMKAALQIMHEHGDTLGDHPGALTWYRHAEAAAGRRGAQLPAGALVAVGLTYSHLEQPEQAQEAFDAAEARLARSDAESAAMSPAEQMRIKAGLGLAYQLGQQFEASIAKHREVVALAEELYGRESLPWAKAAVDLGDALAQFQRFGEGAEYFKEALPILKRVHGSEHWEVADAQIRLGMTLMPAGRFEEAIPLMREGADTAERLADESNPRVLFARINLTDALYYVQKWDEAHALLVRLQAIMEAKHGPESSRTAMILYRRGRVLSHLEGAAAAEPFYQRAVKLFDAAPGIEPAEIEARGSLALALTERGAHDEAVVHARRSLEVVHEAFGEGNRASAEATWQMQRVFREAGQAQEFLAATERAVERSRRPEPIPSTSRGRGGSLRARTSRPIRRLT